MFLRITRAIGPDVAAAFRRLPGFQGYHAGVDRARGTIISISIWDTEEHAQVPRDALGEIARRLDPLGVQVEPLEVYEETVSA